MARKGSGRAGKGGVKAKVYVKGKKSLVVKYANKPKANPRSFINAVEKKQTQVFINSGFDRDK